MKEAFGVLSTDWKEGINWSAVREWRLRRAREAMQRHGLGAILCMYDENLRYISSTLTPGWNRLKPGLRYGILVEGKEPIVYEQGDIGKHLEVHNPWLPKENIRYSYSWIKGAAGPASEQQVEKFTRALLDDLEEAVRHIRTWSTGHTEAILTTSLPNARRFAATTDSAAVMVNASTRFTDGEEFGFGAEIGISTQKLHARGPMGLPELTTTTYVVTGDGHVRG
jgi:hypothetical protein